MSGGVRLALALPWLALLVVARWVPSERLVPGGDLRKSMPARIGGRRAADARAARAAAAVRRAVVRVTCAARNRIRHAADAGRRSVHRAAPIGAGA